MTDESKIVYPPKPDPKELKRCKWVLTGECKEPVGSETWVVLWDNCFMPWNRTTGIPTEHEIYGLNRWIIRPTRYAQVIMWLRDKIEGHLGWDLEWLWDKIY